MKPPEQVRRQIVEQAFRFPTEAPDASLEDVQHAVNLAIAVRGSVVAAIEERL